MMASTTNNMADEGFALRRAELLELAREVNAHFEEIHQEMSKILARGDIPMAA